MRVQVREVLLEQDDFKPNFIPSSELFDWLLSYPDMPRAVRVAHYHIDEIDMPSFGTESLDPNTHCQSELVLTELLFLGRASTHLGMGVQFVLLTDGAARHCDRHHSLTDSDLHFEQSSGASSIPRQAVLLVE